MTMFVLIEPDPADSEYLDGGILRINGPFASEDEARQWGQQNGKNLHHIHPVEDKGQHALPDDVEAEQASPPRWRAIVDALAAAGRHTSTAPPAVVNAMWQNDGTAGLSLQCQSPGCQWWHEVPMEYGDVSAEAPLSVLVKLADAHRAEAHPDIQPGR